jgi:hypothetical protein
MSAEKQGEVKLGEAKLIGGNEIDRKRVMEQFHAYLEANSKFDWTRLSQCLSEEFLNHMNHL